MSLSSKKSNICKNLLTDKGQSSLEFAIVAVIIMIVICSLGLFLHMAANGKLAKIIDSSTSHDISKPEGFLDVALY